MLQRLGDGGGYCGGGSGAGAAGVEGEGGAESFAGDVRGGVSLIGVTSSWTEGYGGCGCVETHGCGG